MRKAEGTRDAAPRFLFPAVRLDTGQSPHERGLSVVDVAGGADDDVLGQGSVLSRSDEDGVSTLTPPSDAGKAHAHSIARIRGPMRLVSRLFALTLATIAAHAATLEVRNQWDDVASVDFTC